VIRGTLAALATVLVLAGSASAGQQYIVSYHAFALPKGGVTASSWTSPTYMTGFGFSELVASWNAQTPAGTYITVSMSAARGDGTFTKWYAMGIWAYGDGDIQRTSVGGQGDADGYVSIDTFFAKDHPLYGYRLKVELHGSGATVTRLGAVASDPVNTNPYVPSTTTMTRTVDLHVPSYSQEIHAGEYPQFDGGGEAWCSPTSTSMVVAYWGKGPSRNDYSYVYRDYPNVVDPWIDYAARYTFDYHYHGAGNWPFNTAYAAHFGLESEVTQLHSLAEAEQFIKAGIPLVASIAFEPNKLDGFLFRGTDGHLLVIGGFTAEGNVISYDPASSSDATVRHVYDRAQFEKAWMAATGGIVYVIHPASVALPPSLLGNW
jgi:Peptidase_C39 like family